MADAPSPEIGSPIRIEDDGFELLCLGPGSHRIDIPEGHAILDVYLGKSEAQATYTHPEDSSRKLSANAFSFVPDGFTKTLETIRSGPSVLLIFRPSSVRIIPARQAIEGAYDPIWNVVDPAMSGAGIIALDYLTTPDHVVKKSETHFLRDLLSIRLLQILSGLKKSPVFSKSPRFVQLALEYVDRNISEKISLEDVAVHSGVSPFHFARLFRSALGVSLRRYVILRRLELAQDMIASSDCSLAEVAYAVGFSSQSHMTTLFTRFTGRTPASFRGETIL
ncbi:MAG: AraC family transcriptional regulator [Pseudomonadota bacterium]